MDCRTSLAAVALHTHPGKKLAVRMDFRLVVRKGFRLVECKGCRLAGRTDLIDRSHLDYCILRIAVDDEISNRCNCMLYLRREAQDLFSHAISLAK